MAKQGMDPQLVQNTRESLQRQVDALATIASDLSTTRSAAQYPQNWGIEPGEMTVAPASIPSIATAKAHLAAAKAAAGTMLSRLDGETAAQEEASGNVVHEFASGIATGMGDVGGARPVVDSVRWWRNWISMPRSLFETPAALRMLWNQPALWRTVVQPGTWGIKNTLAAGSALKDFTRTSNTPRWIRGTYQAASNLKWQNYLDPAYLHTISAHKRPPAWTNAFDITTTNSKIVAGAKPVAAVIGKGFGVLGIGVGIASTASAVAGMTDGDITVDDGLALADGIIGTVTSIGSLAPPPAGLVFAGVGAAWTAGRWLFGEGEDGKTGIDKIGDFGKSAGTVIADSADAVGDFFGGLWGK